jgi:hypothetical protein
MTTIFMKSMFVTICAVSFVGCTVDTPTADDLLPLVKHDMKDRYASEIQVSDINCAKTQNGSACEMMVSAKLQVVKAVLENGKVLIKGVIEPYHEKRTLTVAKGDKGWVQTSPF